MIIQKSGVVSEEDSIQKSCISVEFIPCKGLILDETIKAHSCRPAY